jgi:hypothetical protein
MRAMLAALLLAAAIPTAAAPPPPQCDAACLTGLATDLAGALAVRGTSARLPWADRVRYAENGVPMMIDDGIWATVTALGTAPLVVTDPASGTAVWMGEIAEHGQPSFLAFRLKAQGRSIAEAEQVIRRQQGRPPFADPATFAFDAGLTATLPAKARLPRARMEAIVRSYYSAVGGKGAAPRFAPDCARTENGVTVAQDCATPFRLGLFGDVEGVRGLSLPVVDADRGLVVAMGMRDYAARSAELKAADGRSYPADARFPHSYAFVAVFKIVGGGITRIQEVSSSVPYRMPTWGDRP